jgi:hypothetical protein
MSRETDWHVFDKACEITAMAARGAAAGVKGDQIAEIFRQVHAALRETADAMEGGRPAGF